MSKHLIAAHTAVFCFGWAGVLGKIIPLDAEHIVLLRAFIAAIFLMFVILLTKESPKGLSRKDWHFFILQGGLLAFHWFTFFAAIQWASVAIGVLLFSTFPIFSILLAPLVLKESIRPRELSLATLSFIGAVIIVVPLEWQSDYGQGVLAGIGCSISFALLSLFNKKYAHQYSSNVLAFGQNLFAGVFLLPFLWVDMSWQLDIKDWINIALLGVVCTGIAHTLFIYSMQKISAQSASIIAGLEAVYGIGLAYFVLEEIPSVKILVGGLLILIAGLWISLPEQEAH